jgi:hypothetical protein
MYSCGTTVVSKQSADALATTNGSALHSGHWGGEEQDVSFALVISLGVEMADEFG